jgi:tRNA dimethylallyltransferase
MSNPSLPLLIALVGPTAVGKTALAIELARRIGGEIVNADSRQVYRQMDIGTAKPTPSERAAAPHHLLDIVDPDEPFSLAVYSELAAETIAAITARGNVALLVGGTGQYVAAVIEGWQIPRVPPQPELRARLQQEAEEQGVGALYTRLQKHDPHAAVTIEPNNTRRIIRALEVLHVTGQPISEQQRKQPPPYRITTLCLQLARNELYPRIDARVDAMIAAGLLDEVRGLIERGYGWELPAMSSLGYKEWKPYFEGSASHEECVQRLKWNTHAFVRKQEMWFRRLPHTVAIPADDVPIERAVAAIKGAGD